MTGKTARARVKAAAGCRDRGHILSGFVTFVILLFYGMVFVGAFSRLWGIDYTPTLNNFIHVFVKLGAKSILDTLELSLIATPISGSLASSSPIS